MSQTQYPDIFAALCAPFDKDEVKRRAGQGGRQMHYITARTAMNRLDQVLGPENWWDDYHPLENSVICKLTIRLPDGRVVTKQDAGGYAGMDDHGDDDKSGFSDAFKRGCAKFGVARYLYRDGVPKFDVEDQPGELGGEEREVLSEVALARSEPTPGPMKDDPNTGGRLFAWIKSIQEEKGPGLLREVTMWAKTRDFPGRMAEWDAGQVAETCNFVRDCMANGLPSHRGDGRYEAPREAPQRTQAPATAPRTTDAARAKKCNDLRVNLAGTIREWIMKDNPNIDRKDIKSADLLTKIKELDGLVPHEFVVESIRLCDDPAKIDKYLEYAEMQITMMFD